MTAAEPRGVVSNPCTNCGAEVGAENPPSKPGGHCGNCPPWRCEDCGEMSSAADLCSCWTRLDGLPLADLKAIFADMDLSLAPPPEVSR